MHGHAAELRNILETLQVGQADGILLDLGVSSYQLETAARGFSFARGSTGYADGPNGGVTAATLINTLGEWELVNVSGAMGKSTGPGGSPGAILRARRRARCRPLKI